MASLSIVLVVLYSSWIVVLSQIVVNVNVFTDDGHSVNNCQTGGDCSLRDAWDTCKNVSSPIVDCTVLLRARSEIIVNSTVGPLVLENSNNIKILSEEDFSIIRSDEEATDGVFSRFVYFASDSTGIQTIFLLERLQLSGFGSSDIIGGAIYISGNAHLSINNCSFTENSADRGGAIYVHSNYAGIEIMNSEFLSNTAGWSGGAVALDYNVSGILIENSTFAECQASSYGGAIYVGEHIQDFTLRGGIIYGGRAYLGGGLSIHNYNYNILVEGTIFYSTSATELGGAVYVKADNRNVAFVGFAVASTKSYGDGGGVHVHFRNENVTIVDSIFYQSSAVNKGGGLYVGEDNHRMTIADSYFVECEAFWEEGGGIVLEKNNDFLVVEHITALDCTANNGGGGIALLLGNDHTLIKDSLFDTCKSYADGGGMMMGSVNLHMRVENSTFTGCRGQQGGALALIRETNNFTLTESLIENCAGQYGGALLTLTSHDRVFIHKTEFINNRATDGGAIHSNPLTKQLIVSGSRFYRNSATHEGGAIFLNGANEKFLITDTETAHRTVIGETTHPYECVGSPMLVLYHHDPNATALQVQIDSQSVVGPQDYLYIYDAFGNEEYFGNFAMQWPGVDRPPLVIAGTTVEVRIDCDAADPATLSGTLYGLRVFVTPIVENPGESTTFELNRAGDSGGAIALPYAAAFGRIINAEFVHNIAVDGSGGAISLGSASTSVVVRTSLFLANEASIDGGAVAVGSACDSTDFIGCNFELNRAGDSGGALAVIYGNGATAILTGGTHTTVHFCTFTNNFADRGGALYIDKGNVLTVRVSQLLHNKARSDGGGIYVATDNTLTLDLSTIAHGSAGNSGGGFASEARNTLEFKDLTIQNNTAEMYGGGVYMSDRTVLSIKRNVRIVNNAAAVAGGGLASFTCELWKRDPDESWMFQFRLTLSGNRAQRGSAVYFKALQSPSSLRTTHSKSSAGTYDVDSFGDEGVFLPHRLSLNTTDDDNYDDQNNSTDDAVPSEDDSIGDDGGVGDDFPGSPDDDFDWYAYYHQHDDDPDTTIADNVATVGGTVYWLYDSDMTSEPEGLKIEWSNNVALYGERVATQAIQVQGPAEYTVEVFGQALDPPLEFELHDYYGQKMPIQGPTTVSAKLDETFNSHCSGRTSFLSGSRQEEITGTVKFASLEANCAPGGEIKVQFTAALLDLVEAGATGSLDNYAITKTVTMTYRSCRRGEYIQDGQCVTCPTGTYSLEYPVTQDTECVDCTGKSGVVTCYGDVIEVSGGYWRRHNTSEAVLDCLGDVNGCIGGEGTGDALCEEGYEGPLCAVCADGYYSSNGVCELCSGDTKLKTTTIVFIGIAGVVILIAFFMFYAKILDGGFSRSRRVSSVKNWMQEKFDEVRAELKIVITTYQIVSEVPGNLNVQLPPSFTSFLKAFAVFNFNVISVVPFSCTRHYTFIDKLMATTLFPIGLSLLLALLCAADVARLTYMSITYGKDTKERIRTVKDQYLTYFFFLTYLVLPSVSTTIFQTFLCTNVDPSGEDDDEYDLYLIADMSISCTSSYYYRGVAYAVVMLLVYVVGIPLMYFLLLYYNREAIARRDDPVEQDDAGQAEQAASTKSVGDSQIIVPTVAKRELPSAVKSISFLWDAYEPQFWCWEVVETTRRLMLTAVLSVCGPGTSAQSIFAVLLGLLYIKLYGFFAPYEEDNDDVVAEVGQFQIFFTFLGALIYQNSLLGSEWNDAVSVVLILINGAVTALFIYYGFVNIVKDWKASKERVRSRKEERQRYEDLFWVLPGDVELTEQRSGGDGADGDGVGEEQKDLGEEFNFDNSDVDMNYARDRFPGDYGWK